MLVYEYVNNGNLEQWLHGAMRQHGYLTWEARMKILLGTAKALVTSLNQIYPKKFWVHFCFTHDIPIAGFPTCMKQLSQKWCIETLSPAIY